MACVDIQTRNHDDFDMIYDSITDRLYIVIIVLRDKYYFASILVKDIVELNGKTVDLHEISIFRHLKGDHGNIQIGSFISVIYHANGSMILSMRTNHALVKISLNHIEDKIVSEHHINDATKHLIMKSYEVQYKFVSEKSYNPYVCGENYAIFTGCYQSGQPDILNLIGVPLNLFQSQILGSLHLLAHTQIQASK